jgi:hypothetical protein
VAQKRADERLLKAVQASIDADLLEEAATMVTKKLGGRD